MVQEKEVYQGKWIYYSINNLIVDQYFRPETQARILVRATVDPIPKSIATEAVTIQLLNNGQTVLAED